MLAFLLKLPYDPSYGDSESQSSHAAADQLVQEVSEGASRLVHPFHHILVKIVCVFLD